MKAFLIWVVKFHPMKKNLRKCIELRYLIRVLETSFTFQKLLKVWYILLACFCIMEQKLGSELGRFKQTASTASKALVSNHNTRQCNSPQNDDFH